MSEKQVRKTVTDDGKQVRKLKTRCYYTDFVNHCVRFYLSTPKALQMDGKKKADIDNWLAVQYVWNKLPDNQKQVLTAVYGTHHHLGKAVEMYCSKTGTDVNDVWILVTKTAAAVAKSRGLV